MASRCRMCVCVCVCMHDNQLHADSSPYTANIGVTVVITLIVVLVVSALVVLGIVLKRRGSLPCVRRKRDNRSAKGEAYSL
jgi:hypothetical protein